MKLDICNGDVMAWTRTYSAEKFHAMLCDPPYHLHNGKDDKGGFMSQRWDGGQLAFQPETWAALGEHLHPGAFIMAFASSRGWHRLACAIEDAGFVMHPSVFMLGYAFGQGFPKATRVPDERFAGHRYGLQSVKPALEPVIVAQKPYGKRPVDSITETGAGSLWIDGARIEAPDEIKPFGTSVKSSGGIMNGTGERRAPFVPDSGGRWPPNLALLHSPLCNGVCAPGCPVAALDRQSGVLTTNAGTGTSTGSIFGKGVARHHAHERDSGGASRFFHCSNWNAEVEERLVEAEPVRYAAKVSSRERNAGCEGRALENWMEGHTAPIPQRDERDSPGSANPHPCLKPLSLTTWCSKLLLPPVEYAPRRILVPFAGTMSEGMGAAMAGFEHITAIEQSAEYVDIAQRRIRHHLGMLAEVELQVLEEAE